MYIIHTIDRWTDRQTDRQAGKETDTDTDIFYKHEVYKNI